MRIVSRQEWGCKSKFSRRMTLPAKEVWIHHSVTRVTHDPFADMRTIDQVGISRFGQMSYSYGIHQDGTLMEGAGENRGAHTADRNSFAFGVVFIGNYEQLTVKIQQVASFHFLRDRLLDRRVLRPGVYPTGGHRSIAKTACPGNNLFAKIPMLREPWTPAPEVHLPEGVPVANAPFAAILVHPNGGYLEIGEDGGVFQFGDPPAPFFGSLGGIILNQPIVDAAWTQTHMGYYLIGRDGGIFPFGDARYQGNVLWPG